MPLRHSLAAISGLLLLTTTSVTHGQISIPALDTPVTETFSGLGKNAVATLPSGWKADSLTLTTTYASAGTQTTQAAGTSGPGALTSTSPGGTYNFASGNLNSGSADRAVGWLSGSTYASNRNLFAQVTNNTGGTVSKLTLSYNIEKYRDGTAANSISFFTSLNGSTWTAAAAGDHSFAAGTSTAVVNPPASVSKTVTLTGLSLANGASIYLRWNYNGTAAANAQALAIDDVRLTASGPSIQTSLSALPAFGTLRLDTTSPETSYSVSAASLTGDVIVAAPVGYEISTSSETGFASSLSLTPTDGNLTTTTIYVRFTPAANGTIAGNIAHSSPAVATRNVAVTGSGDGIPPSIAFSAPSAAQTTISPVSYTVTYTGAETVTLAAEDILVNATGTSTATVSVSGTGSISRTVTLSGISGTGTLGISLAAGTAVDAVGNSALTAGPSATFAVDNTPPAVSISSPTPAESLAGPVSYTVTYTGATAVTLSPADITLLATGTTTGTVNVTGAGLTSRLVTITGISGTGTLSIAVAPGTASDSAGNLAPAATAPSAAVIDLEGPSLTFSPPSAFHIVSGNVNYKVTYSGADLITLTPADIIVNTTGSVTLTVLVEVGESARNRNIKLQGLSGNGEVSISIRAGSAIDSLGNLAPAAGPSLSFFVDGTAPSVVSATAITTCAMDITFSEVMGADVLTTTSYVVTGAGVGTLTPCPHHVATLTTETVRLHWHSQKEMRTGEPLVVLVSNVHDQAGNLLTLPDSAITTGIGEAPTVLSLLAQSGQSVDVSFSEPVNAEALNPARYTVSGFGQGSVLPQPDAVALVSENTYRLTWNEGSMIFGQPLSLTVSEVSDEAGNVIEPSNTTTAAALPVTLSGFSAE